MIQKVVRKANLGDFSEVRDNLSYWLSKQPEERVESVEYLRRMHHGSSARLQSLLALFNAHRVEYIIVGAYALAYHGAPRSTGDMDILVRPHPENAQTNGEGAGRIWFWLSWFRG